MPDFDPPLVLQNRTGLAKPAFAARVLNVAVSREIYADFLGSGGVSPPPARAQGLSEAQAVAQDESARNARCHCGSGRRFKHCHGAGSAPV